MSIKRTQPLTQISLEDSRKYIPLEEDLMGFPARFYAYKPLEEDWEEVLYLTSRPSSLSIQFSPELSPQWIYILSNSSIPGLLKIGYTKELPGERVKQINASTGVALDFNVEYTFPCFNAHSLENEIHTFLQEKGYRVNPKREFFKIDLKEAISLVNKLGERYKGISS